MTRLIGIAANTLLRLGFKTGWMIIGTGLTVFWAWVAFMVALLISGCTMLQPDIRVDGLVADKALVKGEPTLLVRDGERQIVIRDRKLFEEFQRGDSLVMYLTCNKILYAGKK